MFTLLPIQILFSAVGAVNNIVSSYFASNYVGIDAMSAVGLYSPIAQLLAAIGTLLSGGSAIICSKYLGRNEHDKLQHVFALNIILSVAISAILAGLFLAGGLFDLTGFFTTDAVIRPLFNRYLLGQAIGILPTLLGAQFPVFLSIENRSNRTFIASIIYIAVNLIFNLCFIQILHLEEFGIALASSLGMWIFMLVEAQYFLSKDSELKFRFGGIPFRKTGDIISIGLPGAASYIYQTFRGLIVNRLLEIHIGSAGISAFAAANNVMGIFWGIPGGMLAVSRLLIGVSAGEEDRKSMADVLRNMFRYYLPMMFAIDLLIIFFADPTAGIFFRDPASPVRKMMADGLRILPLCMPLSIILMHFTCYGQAMKKYVYINVLALLDGVVGVALFSWLLIKPLGINAVYIANVINGIITTLYIILYSLFMRKKMPRNVEDLMVIPDNFGVSEEDRIDISVASLEEVVDLSKRIQDFCLSRGIDKKRSYLAALAMEEMAGNVVSHGFGKDGKKHYVDIRVSDKDDELIMRIKDDCVPFDPATRREMIEGDDIARNIGIRMVYRLAMDVSYQNILGLNVLSIKI